MLENLIGPDGVPSEELVNDIRDLCGLGADDLSAMAKVFAEFGESIVSNQADALKSIEKNVKAFQKNRKLLESALPASGFILHRWARHNLTRKQILDDLVGIGISDEQRKNISPLLDAMEGNIGSIRDRLLKSNAMNIGVPSIKSATYACDMRALFETNKYEEAQDDNQAYFVLNHFVPIVILEIVSELNEKTTNHSFVLDDKKLEELQNILQRARKRMEKVKMSLGMSNNLKVKVK